MGFREKREAKEAAKAASSVVPESELFTEDPLEALLDEQSDEEFGELELKERAGKPVKLAEWSAQDFSSIYLRFRPHLERHARRFLSNPSQVDEVVQDAFLYLMVSLPELDSEIGVLRFLKWKTRLLALDVIRASGKAYINSIDDVKEPESLDPEVSSHLEQQDDAAVVRLALSKLNPRHREVLIASMYEEKSTEQIAAQVGLSENATRQLIFRARAAFKKALIGDIDTTGMSAAAILSVAARKAAAEGKKIGASAMALIALVVMSMTMWPGLGRAPESQLAETLETPSSQGETPASQAPESQASSGPEAEASAGAESNSAAASPGSSSDSSSGSSSAGNSAARSSTPTPTPSAKETDPAELVLSGPALGGIMNSDSGSKIFVLNQDYTAVGDNGITAKFTFNPTTDQIFSAVRVEIRLENLVFDFKPTDPFIIQGKNSDGLETYILVGKSPYLYDEYGQKWTETQATGANFKLEVIMEPNGTAVKEIRLALFAGN